MRRRGLKPYFYSGFIFFLILAGCGEKQPTVEELLAQAEVMLDSGQIGNAILILERCQEISADRVDVLEALAFAHAANKDPMMAALTFNRIVELVPNQPEYALYAAESLIEAGDIKGAIAQYEQYLQVRPDDRAIHVTLSSILEETGNLGKALESLLAAERIESRGEQQLAIGRLYLQRGNLAQAQAWYARALNGGSDIRGEAMLGLLETAVRAGRFNDAEALLSQLDAEYPGRLDQSSLDGVRDQLHEWRRRQDEAMQAVVALEEEPNLTSVNDPGQETSGTDGESVAEESIAEQIGGPSAESADTEEAVAVDEDPEPLAPEPEPQILPSPVDLAAEFLEEARSLKASGAVAEAIQAYKQSLVHFDSQPEVWAELSETYLEAGQARWAQATASEAIRRDPDNPKWTLQFLRASRQTMGGGRLIRELEDAYRKFPDNLEIILVLARTYRDLGNKRNASILYGRFLELAQRGHPEWASVMYELESLSH